MPGIKRRFVNLGSSRSVEKRSLKQKKFEVQLNTVKKVRICYTDPDATDSDSDVNRDDRNVGRKRIVHEIIRICDSAYKKSERKPFKKYQVPNFSEEGYPERPFQKMRSLKEIFGKSDVKILRSSSSTSYIGVQKRKSGKFGAEIRDPFTRKRVWLGTYDNEENAAIAYQVKKLEFDQFRMMDKNSIMSTTSAVQNLENTSFASDETNDRCSHPSPSSVLDMASSVPNVKSHAKPSKQANSVAMLDVDLPVLASVPSKYINAVEELQSSSEKQSVPVFSFPESIQGTWDTMQFGTEGLQISGCLADPYSSPSIIQEIYLEENLQQEGNDLKVLGFEDLEPGIFPEEMFYDPERLHNDLLEINKEMLTWVDSLVLEA